mmetsp:Transcript_12875/g.37076  ORF Transcript_12875/g.37076 Transcript_12875/m.37076 type:complete len:517 (-) Transcript_12875:3-1553(-)
MIRHAAGVDGRRLEILEPRRQLVALQVRPVPRLLLELAHPEGPRRAGQVREGALAREGVVHPLHEQAPVQRHAAAVPRGDALQALDELRRQRARGLHRRRGQLLHELHEAPRGGGGRGDVALELAEQGLALVYATDRVELRACDAIRRQADPIRDDDVRRLGLRVVQGARLLQEGLALGELPAAVAQRRAVEPAQRHVARRAALVLHEVRLQIDALLVGVAPVAVGGLLELPHDGRGGVLLGIRRQRHDDLSAHLAQPLAGGCPIGVRLELRQALQHLDGGRGGVHPAQVQHHVGVHEQIHVAILQGGLRPQARHPHRRLEPLRQLLVHEALERGREHRRLPEREPLAVGEPALEHFRCNSAAGRMLAKDGRRGGAAPHLASGGEGVDVPIVLRHEQAVEHVLRHTHLKAIARHLGQRPEGWQHEVLQRLHAALGADAVPLAEGELQLLEERVGGLLLSRAGGAEEAEGARAHSGQERETQAAHGGQRHEYGGNGGRHAVPADFPCAKGMQEPSGV